MTRKKVEPLLKEIIFREKTRSPHLGVRPLSSLLKKKYKVTLSKTTINKILTSAGLKEKRGRKKSLLIYKGRAFGQCGLFLLRCLDYQVGLFDYLSEELKKYFPGINKKILKQLIILNSFSALINEEPEKSIKRKGFLRLAGPERLPVRKIDYFRHQLFLREPRVNLKPLKRGLALVSTIKFYFNNDYCAYFDAKMSTFWNGLCGMERFFLPLRAATNLIEQMIKDKTIIVGYTKSFGYLSALTFDFLKAVDSGVKKIEFVDEQNRILEERKINLSKVSFFIGYYPKVISKGINFIGKPKRFKSFFLGGVGDFLCSSGLTKLTQYQGKQQLILNNIFIKQPSFSLPTWGILTGNISGKKVRITAFLKKYLYLWPNAEKSFIEDLKIIEKSLFTASKSKDYLAKMLPQKLVFKEMLDFSRAGQILSVIFKETIWGWEPKNKEGDFVWGKDYLRINLEKMPKEAKKNFNRERFYLDGKRVFLF